MLSFRYHCVKKLLSPFRGYTCTHTCTHTRTRARREGDTLPLLSYLTLPRAHSPTHGEGQRKLGRALSNHRLRRRTCSAPVRVDCRRQCYGNVTKGALDLSHFSVPLSNWGAGLSQPYSPPRESSLVSLLPYGKEGNKLKKIDMTKRKQKR